jgi:molybdenum cofactor cytidylyltransferase
MKLKHATRATLLCHVSVTSEVTDVIADGRARQTAPVTDPATDPVNDRPATAAVVLAAGAGTRFTGPTHKLDAELGGRPLVRHAIDAAVDAGIGPVIVVTAGHVTTPLPPSVVVVTNESWHQGQMSSLRLGIATAAAGGAHSVVVGLGDQPFVPADAWRAVAAADAPIAVATYAGRRGHPVRLQESVWDLLPTGGDEGARSLMRLRPDLVIEVPCQGSPTDVDTLEDLRRWQNNSSTSSP